MYLSKSINWLKRSQLYLTEVFENNILGQLRRVKR